MFCQLFILKLCTTELRRISSLIEFKNVSKTFRGQQKNQHVRAVENVSFKVADGEIYGVMGYSGAGKSTLIRMINGLEKPTDGDVIVDGESVADLSKKELLQLRRKIGMIFQSYNLLVTATVAQNIILPLTLEGLDKTEAEQRAEKYLKIVDLWDKRDSYPAQLSGGQRQRVAVARALAHEPKILLSDEATSALDPETTESILSLLLKINQELGITIFLITHEMNVIQRVCDRVAVLDAGVIAEEGPVVDVFTQPKQGITRKFAGVSDTLGVPRDILKPYAEKHRLISLQFVGQTANEPLLAQVQDKFDVTPDILAGSMGYMKREPYGRLLVYLKADQQDQFDGALEFIRSQDVHVEEVEI
jgi:D-methionine transport system ATP-binding protein